MEISCGASIAVESKGGGLCMDFARDELKSHLLAMFNRLDFDAKKPETKILLEVRNSPVLRHDGYQILITEQGARITSRMERGVLHGVYHLLRMLGCSFWFSKTSVQIVPTVRRKTLESGLFTENPFVESRGICLYGITGKAVADVLASVDFMAKNGYNLLFTTYHRKGTAPAGAEAVFWDEVEATLLPHLEKRGIELCLWLEEGPAPGASREKGHALAPKHFCRAEDAALDAYLDELCAYLSAHTAISILGPWPSCLFDTACDWRCADKPRAVAVMTRINDAIKAVRPDITLMHRGHAAPDAEKPMPDGSAALLNGPEHAFAWVEALGDRGAVYLLDDEMANNARWQSNLWVQPHIGKAVVAAAANAGCKGVISIWRPLSAWWAASLNFSFLSEAYYHPEFSINVMIEKFANDLWGFYGPSLVKAIALLYANIQDSAIWSRPPRAANGICDHPHKRNAALDLQNLRAFKARLAEIQILLDEVPIARLDEHGRYHFDCLKAYITQQEQFFLLIDQFSANSDTAQKADAYYALLDENRRAIGEGFTSGEYAHWCMKKQNFLCENPE